MLISYEALRDLPLENIEVETPIEKAQCDVIAGKKPAIVPILRAGLGMVDGLLKLMPVAKVGHIGLYRDEKTFEPHEYYCKLPTAIEQRKIFVVDPMLATGGSAIAAIDFIKQRGGKDITFLCVIAASEGLEKLAKAHPDVKVFVGNLDRGLNENAYYCTNLRRSSNIISAFYDSTLSEVGLTVAQYYLLINLSRLGSANITHWAGHVGLERSTMVRNIKVLQERNFIELAEGHGKTFTLSTEGKRVLEVAVPLWNEALAQIESLLGKEDIEAVFRISEKLQGLKQK